MTNLTGRIMRPGYPGWNGARHGFAQRFDYNDNEPQVIVFCQSAGDVSNAVRWARENEVPIRIRSGRHNYMAYSSLIKNGIIIDVSEIEQVTMNMDALTATVGAGIDMLTLTELLAESSMAIPLATGPSVGLAGLTLGGGFGITSRKFCMTCDNVLDVEMVNANGEIIHANANENPELYWALRGGGGGNFGVVTAFTFRLHPVGIVGAFNWSWTWDKFEEVVDTWQKWAPDHPEDGLTSILTLTSDPLTGTKLVTMSGQLTGDPETVMQIHQMLEPMLATGPIIVGTQIVPFVNAARAFFGVDVMNPSWAILQHSDEQLFKSTSAFAFELLSPEAIAMMKDGLDNVPPLSAPPSQPSMIQLLGCGGAPSRIPPDATPVYARHCKFIVQYDGYWTAPEDAQPTIDWVVNFRDRMLPHAYGAYTNYSDDMVLNPMAAYYAQNFPRLQSVKTQYDPENVFNFAQSIPVGNAIVTAPGPSPEVECASS